MSDYEKLHHHKLSNDSCHSNTETLIPEPVVQVAHPSPMGSAQASKDSVCHGMFRVTSVCHTCGEEGTSEKTPHGAGAEEVTILTFKCSHCGAKTDKLMTGGVFPERGKRIILRVVDYSDLNRQALKSRSASLEIPELELQLSPGARGGAFTTIAGLLEHLKKDLRFIKGFAAKVDGLLRCETPFTVILDDPLSGIFVQNLFSHLPAPENVDPRLEITEYIRTFDQDEELGIHDMKVEGYELEDETM